MLIHVQIVHKEMVLAGVMKIANGSMDNVDLKISAKGIVALIDPFAYTFITTNLVSLSTGVPYYYGSQLYDFH